MAETSSINNEPYQGVAALFNGDLHLVEPRWAPRTHWEVVSETKIRHLPVNEILKQEGEVVDDKKEEK